MLVGCLVGLLFWLYDATAALKLGGLLLLYFIPPAGKESIIPAGIALGFPFQIVSFSVVLVDIACCLFMVWNFELICNVPYLGNVIRYLIMKSEIYLNEHRWLERLYFVGLIMFVFFPLQGTGSISGSIIGKMLGLKTIEIMGAITIGSVLSSFLIGYSVYALNEYLDINVWSILATIMITLVLIPVLLYGIYHTQAGRTICAKISTWMHIFLSLLKNH